MASKQVVRVQSDTPKLSIKEIETGNFLENFRKNFDIEIKDLTDERILFDMIGIDASIANAFRRILLSEVPTMAIEHVYIWNNSSIIQDEVLAHRLGLIPLNVDPRQFESFPEHEEAEATDANTIVFKLDITCKINPEHPNDPSKAINAYVYSSHLEWIPQGTQEERFGSIRPVHEDILIAKLRPGQSIALEAHCRKGVGKDHAKFSPVCTASYRLLPNIVLKEKIIGDDAKILKEKCPMNVFDIEDLGNKQQATVKNPRNCTMCRECIREPEWNDKIQLNRFTDHFIFSVESVGMLKPEDLLPEAIRVLTEKCDTLLEGVEELEEAMNE